MNSGMIAWFADIAGIVFIDHRFERYDFVFAHGGVDAVVQGEESDTARCRSFALLEAQHHSLWKRKR